MASVFAPTDVARVFVSRTELFDYFAARMGQSAGYAAVLRFMQANPEEGQAFLGHLRDHSAAVIQGAGMHEEQPVRALGAADTVATAAFVLGDADEPPVVAMVDTGEAAPEPEAEAEPVSVEVVVGDVLVESEASAAGMKRKRDALEEHAAPPSPLLVTGDDHSDDAAVEMPKRKRPRRGQSKEERMQWRLPKYFASHAVVRPILLSFLVFPEALMKIDKTRVTFKNEDGNLLLIIKCGVTLCGVAQALFEKHVKARLATVLARHGRTLPDKLEYFTFGTDVDRDLAGGQSRCEAYVQQLDAIFADSPGAFAYMAAQRGHNVKFTFNLALCLGSGEFRRIVHAWFPGVDLPTPTTFRKRAPSVNITPRPKRAVPRPPPRSPTPSPPHTPDRSPSRASDSVQPSESAFEEYSTSGSS